VTDENSLEPGQPLLIGMGGQFYAHEAWSSLIHCLNKVGWRIAGRPVVVRCMGREFHAYADTPQRIEFLGWLSQKESVVELNKCHLLYCPYSFFEEDRTISEYSFPSKIPSYLAASRPILYHGPSYGSPVSFIRAHNCGLSCCSIQLSDIYNALEDFLNADYQDLCQNAAAAFLNACTVGTLKTRVEAFFA
jgi:hypothetical protein